MKNHDATYDSGGAMATAPTFIMVRVPLGEIDPLTCRTDQPSGLTCGELMDEAYVRLRDLLTSQSAGHAIPELNTPENLAHEIECCLRAIQQYAVTPSSRCLA